MQTAYTGRAPCVLMAPWRTRSQGSAMHAAAGNGQPAVEARRGSKPYFAAITGERQQWTGRQFACQTSTLPNVTAVQPSGLVSKLSRPGPWSLSKAYSPAPAVLVDELDAGRFESSPNGMESQPPRLMSTRLKLAHRNDTNQCGLREFCLTPA